MLTSCSRNYQDEWLGSCVQESMGAISMIFNGRKFCKKHDRIYRDMCTEYAEEVSTDELIKTKKARLKKLKLKSSDINFWNKSELAYAICMEEKAD